MKAEKRLVILDRDGVINDDSPAYIKSPEECHFIKGSIAAIAALHKAGYLVAIATNQAGIGRGLFSDSIVQDIHAKIRQAVEREGGYIDMIAYCPHHPDEGCYCRKPAPGLLYNISNHLQVSLNEAYVVGDSWRDIEAALKVGAAPLLVKTGNGEKTLLGGHDMTGIKVFNDLAQAVYFIMEKQ